MKRLLSFLLVLTLLLGLTGCAAADDFWQLQAQETSLTPTDGTTEPLFWPPLPTETEETTLPAQQSQEQPGREEQSSQQEQPESKPVQSGSGSNIEATYYPREDEDVRPGAGKGSANQEEGTSQSQQTTQQNNQQNNQQNSQQNNQQSDKPAETTPAQTTPVQTTPTQPPADTGSKIDPNGNYDSKEDVALYIRTYGRLPNNYYTKAQAESLFGWEGGALSKYKAYACIGGDRFYNNKGLMAGYDYYECDIDTIGMSKRGAKRLVFAYNGPIYYTDDHYDNSIMLYGAP